MKKKQKLLLWIVLAVAAIILGGVLYLLINADTLVEKRIRKGLEKEPLAGHTIGFSKFHFSARDKGFEIDSLFIIPDSLASMEEGTRHPGSLIDVHVGQVKVSGISYMALLARKVLRVDEIWINQPVGDIILGAKNDDERQVKEVKVKRKDKNKITLRKLAVGDLKVSDGTLRLHGKDIQDTIYSVDRLNMDIMGIGLNVGRMKVPAEAISFDELKINTTRQVVHLPGGFYDLHISALDIDEKGGQVRVDSIYLVPKYSKKEFGYRFGRQMDRFDVSVGEILVSDFDLRRLLKDKQFIAGMVEVNGAHADIYRDKNIPRKNEKIKPLLNEMILKVKAPLAIDTVYFSDAYVMYGEVPEEESEPGVIFIDEFNLLMENVTNMPERIASNSTMELVGSFMLEGVGPTDMHFSYPLDDASKRYTYVLELHDMALPKLNPMLSPGANIKVYEGQLVNGRFEVSANSDSAWGKAYMKYYGLDMEILKKKPKDEDHEVNKFLSKIANSLIHSENPSDRTGVERVGLIAFERDKYKSQIGFFVKPLIQGMVRVIVPVDTNVEKIEHLSPKMREKEERISRKEAEKLQKLKEKKERKEKKRKGT